MKKTKLVILCLIVLLVPEFSCAREAKRLTVLLDWFVNPDHAPLFVAQEKGFFTQHGLDVELIAPSNPNDPPKLVAAGKADIAVSYQHQLQMQIDQGLPLIRIATLVATPLNSLVVLEDSGIRSIADLRGKTIGYSVGGFETALLSAMLSEAGLTLDDVKLVNVNFSLSPALLSKTADAVIGAFRNFELNQLELEGHRGRAFFVEEHGVPAYEELILVARRDHVSRPELRAFVDALEDGVQYLINHPDECWQLFIGGKRADLDNELNRRAWHDSLPRFALRPGALDHTRYQRFASFLKKQGVISAIPDLDETAAELK